MSGEEPGEFTRLLQSWGEGGAEAFNQLVPLVYDQLHRIALGLTRRERSVNTLQASERVVHVAAPPAQGAVEGPRPLPYSGNPCAAIDPCIGDGVAFTAITREAPVLRYPTADNAARREADKVEASWRAGAQITARS
ncbi:MAG: ECF-type sigma factor [Terriglobia bacterium]|jgi:hypothetical protein